MAISILAVWPLDYIGHLAATISHDYGVNPWVYLFIWGVVAAPAWYIGLHWSFKGLASSNHELFRRGVILNRIGYAMAPAYVLVFGHGLGWLTIAWVVAPILWSVWFYRYRLKNPYWIAKNKGWIEGVAQRIEWLITLPVRLPSMTIQLVQLVRMAKLKTVLVPPGTELFDQAVEVERRVFEEEDYPYDYRRYDNQSWMYAVMESREILGVVRSIQATPGLLPPILDECELYDPECWKDLALSGRFVELGTVAVDSKYRNRNVSPLLYRFAGADAYRHGVQYWSVIVEWERAVSLNHKFHFTFERIGKDGYMGWECAPCVLKFDDTLLKMAMNDPKMFKWFTRFFPKQAISQEVLQLH